MNQRVTILRQPPEYAVRRAVYDAVAERVVALRSSWCRRQGDYVYAGRRTAPEEIGWRFLQAWFTTRTDAQGRRGLNGVPDAGMVDEIKAGKHDAGIEAAWHDAASAEYYYRYEKDYGDDRDEREFDESEEPYEDEL